MKRRFYRDRRERKRRWVWKKVPWYQKLKFFTEADVKRFRDYFFEVYSRNLKDPIKSFTVPSSTSEILKETVKIAREIQNTPMPPAESYCTDWSDPRLKLEFNPSRPSTIPPIPSEPRRGREFRTSNEMFPDFDAQKVIYPRWYRLWLWVFPTRMKVEGDRYTEYKIIRGKIYVTDEGEVELLAEDG